MGSTGGGGNIKPAQESSTGHNRHSGNKNHLVPPATTATTEISHNNNGGGGERENRKLISTTISSSSSSQNKAQATVANCRNSSVGGTSKLKSGKSAVRSSSENSKKANKSVTFQDHPGEPGPRSSESGKLVQQVWFTFKLQSCFSHLLHTRPAQFFEKFAAHFFLASTLQF